MSSKVQGEVEIQRNYYADTADRYNELHVHDKGEHDFALAFMVAALEYFNIHSILDVGSGTGKAITYVKAKRPDIKIVGVEPVKELREIGYMQSVSKNELIEGDALSLEFNEGEFDLVCAFGVMHHVRTPQKAVSEMLRVAKRAVFLSDSNNFGQGSFAIRSIKQFINLCGLWKTANFIKTGGKGYTISKGDGLAYSYSVFSSYKQIRRACKSVHLLNTNDSGINPYRTAGHVALFGVKK